jgi:hypothetical protein
MERDRMASTRLIWLRIGTSAGGSYEHGNETSGSIKREILEPLSNWWILKKDSAPWV